MRRPASAGSVSNGSGQRLASRPQSAQVRPQSAQVRPQAVQRPQSAQVRRPQSAQSCGSWAGASAAYISIEPLNVGTPPAAIAHRRMGAARATQVRPRPMSAQPRLMMSAQAAFNPAFAQEMDRWTRARINAHLQRPRPQSAVQPNRIIGWVH